MFKIIANKNHFIFLCIILLLFIAGLNSFFYIIREALGSGNGTFFFTSQDRFADIIKTSLSYKKILITLPNFFNYLNNMSDIYKYFYEQNPYLGVEYVSTSLTHFHLTPISTLLNFIVIAGMGLNLKIKYILIILFISCSLLFIISIHKIFKFYSSFLFLLLSLVSYPLLMAITRGNYQSFICSIGIITFLSNLFIKKNISIYSLILYAIAINFRPNALILLISLLVIFDFKKTFFISLKVIIISALILFISYFTVNYIYPDYTFFNFLNGLKIYNDGYVTGSGGNYFNSSLYGCIKFILTNDFNYNKLLFIIISCFILFYWLILTLKQKINVIYQPFIIVCFYILFNPVAADYHLIVFIFPLMYFYNKFDEINKKDKKNIYIFLSTILILSPKNYYFINSISLQVAINPMIMLITIFYLFKKSITMADKI